jgi:hypothetical protein
MILTGAAMLIAGVSEYTPAMILTGAAMRIAGVLSSFSRPKIMRDV